MEFWVIKGAYRQPSHCSSKGCGLWGAQVASDAIHNSLLRATTVACHDRPPSRHCFQGHDAKVLILWRVQNSARYGEQCAALGIAEAGHKSDLWHNGCPK